MKKIAALLLCLVLLLSFAACGGGSSDTDDKDTVSTSSKADKNDDKSNGKKDDKEDDKSEISITLPSTDAEKEIQKAIDAIKPELDEMKDTYAELGLSVDVEARNTAFVYVFRYTIDIPDVNAVKEALDESFDGLEDTYLSIFSTFKAKCPSIKSIVLEYQAKDGTVITSHEYK